MTNEQHQPPPPSFTWQTADGRVHERHAYGNEGMFSWAMDQCPAKYFATMVNATTITYAATTTDKSSTSGDGLNGSIDNMAQRIRSAWKALRFETPMLATRVPKVAGGGLFEYKMVYSVPSDEAEVERWVEETLFPASEAKSQEELLLHVLNSEKLLANVRPSDSTYAVNMHYSRGHRKGEYTFVIVNSHSVLDGRGYYKTQQRFLELLAEAQPGAAGQTVKWGKEVSNLTLPYEYEAGLRASDDKSPEGLMELLKLAQAGGEATQSYCRLPQNISEAVTSTANVALKRVDIPLSTIQTIQTLAKEHGTRFSYVIATCILMAIYSNSENRDEAKVSVSPFPSIDARTWFEDQSKGNAFRGFASYSGGPLAAGTEALKRITERIDSDGKLPEEFWEIVKPVHAAWDGARASKTVASLQHEFLNAISPAFADTEGFLKATVMQSSIGKVSGNYLQEKIVSSDGKIIIEVQDVFSTIFFSMSRTLGMIYWTWGDKFSIASNWNKDRLDEKVIDSLFTDIEKYINIVAASKTNEAWFRRIEA